MSGNSEIRRLIGILLNNWTGLKIVMYEGDHSNVDINQKLGRLIDVFTSALNSANTGCTPEDLADDIQDFMDSEFDTILEDDSDMQLASDAFTIYSMWCNNETEKLNLFISKFEVTSSILNEVKHDTSRYLKVEKMDVISEEGTSGSSNTENLIEESRNTANNINTSSDNNGANSDDWTVVTKKKRPPL